MVFEKMRFLLKDYFGHYYNTFFSETNTVPKIFKFSKDKL